MKSLKCFAIAMLLLAPAATAQLRVGLSGGLVLSEADQSRLFNTKASSTTKFIWGGLLDFSVTRGLSVVVEPSYVEKGTFARPIDIQGYVPKLSFDQSYLEFPVLLKYSFGSGIRPYIVIGSTVGVNLSSKLRAEIQGPRMARLEIEGDVANLVRDFEYSLEFGGGASYEIDEYISLLVEARYSYGLSNIVRRGSFSASFGTASIESELENDALYRNKGFRIKFGFSFPLKINEQ
jgi:opacity protein-like surface antigen